MPRSFASPRKARTSSPNPPSTWVAPRSAPCSARNGKASAPPIRIRVDSPGEAAEERELVRDLRSAQDHHERSGRVAEELRELLDLLVDEEPRVGREPLRDPNGGRVGPVDRAERLFHEEVAELGEGVGERCRIRLLPRIEPEVLEEGELAVAQGIHSLERTRAGDRVEEGHRLAEIAGEAFGDRPKGPSGVGAPFRATEVGHHDRPSPVLPQVSERRERLEDPAVVRDLPPLVLRHVEVRPDQDSLPLDRRRGDEPLLRHWFGRGVVG